MNSELYPNSIPLDTFLIGTSAYDAEEIDAANIDEAFDIAWKVFSSSYSLTCFGVWRVPEYKEDK